MGKKTSRRSITIRAYRFARLAHRKRRRYFFDVAMLIAASGLIFCEFAFPLADKDISTQSAPSLIALRSIALPSNAAMERYLEARDDFYKRTMNHTRDPLSISVDAYKLLSLQLQYLSYFSTATPLLLDELDTIQLLDRFGKGNLAESSSGRRMISALKSLIGLRPILTQCISDVNEKRHSIEQVLDDTSGRNLAVELDIVTLNALPDLLKDRHSRWRQCQESLSDFDKQMTTLAVTYPVVNEELAKQAARFPEPCRQISQLHRNWVNEQVEKRAGERGALTVATVRELYASHLRVTRGLVHTELRKLGLSLKDPIVRDAFYDVRAEQMALTRAPAKSQ